MGQPSFDERVTAAVKLFTVDESSIVVKNPRQTLAPKDTKSRGSEALEVLRRFRFEAGRLEDIGPLGVGGQSAIRVARQVSLDRDVAVKRLPPNKRAPKQVESLLAEAWLTGALEHPNIVPVHDLGLDEDGSPVLVMKKIEGETWGDLLRGGDLDAYEHDGDPLTFHLRVFMQVCNATHFAHSRGIVHRDLKPDNVMVGYFGEVYVVDWGIATVPKRAKSIAGTPAYLAPEMLAQSETDMLGPATDVYLLGAILHEILTGSPPHLGDDMEAIIASVLRSPPPMPDDAPAELAVLASSCMQLDPSARPATVEAVRKAVERFLEHEGSRAIAREAVARQEELFAEIERKSDDRQRIYALFTECRFGFRHSLRTWPENDEAKEGIRRAAESMIRYELDRRDGPAAAMLLGELPNADDEAGVALAREVRETVARGEAEARKLRELERRHDPSTGNRQRRFFGVMFGVIFALSPLVGEALGRSSPRQLLEGSVFVPILALVILGANWRKVTASAITRGIMSVVAFAMAVQGVVGALVIGFGTPALQSAAFLVALPFYWSFVLGLGTVLFERGFFAGSLAYAVAGFAALRWPHLRFTFVAAANLVICMMAYVVWPRGRDKRRAAAR